MSTAWGPVAPCASLVPGMPAALVAVAVPVAVAVSVGVVPSDESHSLLGIVPALAAGVVVSVLVRRIVRPAPSGRVAELGASSPGSTGSPGDSTSPSPSRLLASWGGTARRVARLPADAQADRRAGAALVALGVVALVEPVLGVAGLSVAGLRSVWVRRRAREHEERAVVDDLPEAVDLLAVALSAGLTVPLSVSLVGQRGRGRVAAALGHADDLRRHGVALADALDRGLSALGDPARGLLRILRSSLEDGTSAGPALERLAAEVRIDRRRAAEGRARRLPVRLLFPLVLCVLPAFALLTVVPLLAGALGGLSL